jgi:hypothetical protein
MPKKSTSARQAQAARRSQTAARSQNVALVRAPNTGDAPSSAAGSASTAAQASTSATRATSAAAAPAKSAARTTTTARPATSTRTAAKPAPRPAAPAQGSFAAREQEKRVARAKEMRRVRSANVVTPEHYRYVIRDLRMTGILAALMFTVIIVLHFVLS